MRTRTLRNKIVKAGKAKRLVALPKFIPGLFLVSAVAILGFAFSAGRADSQFLLRDSNPLTLGSPQCRDNLIQHKYVLPPNDDLSFDRSQSYEQISKAIIGLLTDSNNHSCNMGVSGEIDYSPYTKSFATFPLRSPPLLS